MPEPQVQTVTPNVKLPPPSGDSQRAEKYINQLIPLVSQGKLTVDHTDLSKYDPSSLYDHYRIDMKEYQLEISHSKAPLTGKDSYVLLFNNLKDIEAGYTQKVILAYLVLTADQFKRLQEVADEQIETRKKIEEEKRFSQAMTPVDAMLDQIAKGEVDISKPAQPIPEINFAIQAKSANETANSTVSTPTGQTTPSGLAATDQSGNQPGPPAQVVDQPGIAASPVGDTTLGGSAVPGGDQTTNVSALSALAAAAQTPAQPEPAASPTPLAQSVPVRDTTSAPAELDSAQTKSSPASGEASSVNLTSTPASNQPPNQSNLALAESLLPVQTPPGSPPPNPVAIEEIQKALEKAAQTYQSSQTAPPPNNSPSTGSLPTSPNNQPVNNHNESSAQPTPPPSAGIDQAIDQAFKPADNTLLTRQPN